ncbi:Hint domain-containing protein [Roseovarius aestuariivivens]|uniref:Hint domain-containing protein n=1 Tax=Roseovarius aestuariivivens TaxID=1888910 RepID=UPI00108099B2|nr:Hint domain-containing protein [Roseovarius aestuariivivens]
MEPKTVGRMTGDTVIMPNADATGFLPSSIILTLAGEKRVEDLSAGDRVITRDGGMAVLKDVRSRQISTRAVRIKAGSLGHTRPERDVTVPAGQPVLIRDWRARAVFGATRAMVPAHRLADGEFITLQDHVTMTVFELEFDRPHVLYVDGLEVGSHDAAAALSKAA